MKFELERYSLSEVARVHLTDHRRGNTGNVTPRSMMAIKSSEDDAGDEPRSAPGGREGHATSRNPSEPFQKRGKKNPMSQLIVRERHSGSVAILDLEGQLTLGDGSTELRHVVIRLVNNGSKKILLNLKSVTFMDSSGLGELVSAAARARRNGGELKLTNVMGRVYGLLVITKLATIFETFESEADALKSFEQAHEAST
jgi:anti-sigma B factor antagonist